MKIVPFSANSPISTAMSQIPAGATYPAFGYLSDKTRLLSIGRSSYTVATIDIGLSTEIKGEVITHNYVSGGSQTITGGGYIAP